MKRILFIQLRQLGDILLTTPCIEAAREAFPDAQIDFLAHEMGRQILEDNPYLNSLYTYREKQSLSESWELLKSIRSQSYDCIVDFMGNPRSAFQTFFGKPQDSIAFDSVRRIFYKRSIPKPEQKKYIVDEKFDLLRAVGMKPQNMKLTFPWLSEHLEPFRSLISSREDFAVSKLRVVMSPTHRRQVRRWPVQSYVVLADFLVRTWNATVTWVWGPDEEEYIDQIMTRCKEKTIKAPKTSLKEMAALMANHDLFIGNSNGPSHIAVASNICSLQLHGHTIASSWCPNNQRHRSIQSPVGEENMERSMAVITVPVVIEKLNRMRDEIMAVSDLRREKGIIHDWKQQHL